MRRPSQTRASRSGTTAALMVRNSAVFMGALLSKPAWRQAGGGQEGVRGGSQSNRLQGKGQAPEVIGIRDRGHETRMEGPALPVWCRVFRVALTAARRAGPRAPPAAPAPA